MQVPGNTRISPHWQVRYRYRSDFWQESYSKKYSTEAEAMKHAVALRLVSANLLIVVVERLDLIAEMRGAPAVQATEIFRYEMEV